jgi:hypothetical protein
VQAPDEEETLTTERTGDSRSAGSAAWIRKNGARTLVARCSSKPPVTMTAASFSPEWASTGIVFVLICQAYEHLLIQPLICLAARCMYRRWLGK